MSDITPEDFVTTFKGHAGYDAPSLTIRGATAPELADRIGAAEATALFAIIGNADAAFKAAFNVGSVLGAVPVVHPTAAAAPPRQAPAAAANPPGLVAPVCPHGTKTYKTGTNNRGDWAAWMCPARKGTPGQCPPEWIND